MYFQRTIKHTLQKAATQFPVVAVIGPRQSGKTTLLRHFFASTHQYISLEAPDIRNFALNDPRAFMRLYKPPVIYDEIQYAPEMMSYIKEEVDERRNVPGQYILTGSQNLLSLDKVTQSLAGRVGMLRLLPLSQCEANGDSAKPQIWEREPGSIKTSNHERVWPGIFRGNFPELVRDETRDAHMWHASYVQTYLERDVRSLRQIGDLTIFQNFLTAMALRSGQLLNISNVARDLGTAVNTVKAWLSILEATFQIVILRPYFRNIEKRMVKSPKIYFCDTGTMCYLAGIRSEQEARESHLAGALFETAVFAELYKSIIHRGEQPRMYFWRTASGDEVDFVIDQGSTLIPVEAKSSSTPAVKMGRGLAAFRKSYPELASPGYVVYPGERVLPMGGGSLAVPYDAL